MSRLPPGAAPGVRSHGPPPVELVALHGFGQNGGMFAELSGMLPFGVDALDLPGHGRAADLPVGVESAVDVVCAHLASLPEPSALLGYSQGGRIALLAALQTPHVVTRLVLVSASPGLPTEEERAARRRDDELLAHRIEERGWPAFVDEWLGRPMFAGLAGRPPAWRAADRAMRLEQSGPSMAAVLRAMGQGVQPYVGDLLVELAVPVMVVVGGSDALYREIGERMAARCARGRLEVVAGCGHNVVAERPERLAALVEGYLDPPG